MAQILESIDQRTATKDAAREAVGDRFDAVRKWTKRARKRKGKDPRSVHKMRTSCRRAGAALDAFEDCLPGKRVKKAKKLLKKIRKAGGDLRDLDVQRAMWDRLGAEEPSVRGAADAMIARTEKKRKKARKAFKDEIAGYGPGDIKEMGRKLCKKAEHARVDGRGAERMGVFAKDSLAAMCEELRERVADGPLSPDGLHKARIAEKRIRYAVELFDHCLDRGIAAQLGEDLKELHDGLGHEHDLVEARELLVTLEAKGKVEREVAEPLRRVVDDRLIDAHRSAEAKLAEFVERWLDETLVKADFFVQAEPAGA